MASPHQIEQALMQVRDQSSFIQKLLVDTLEWPLDRGMGRVEEISFGWSQDELRAAGLDAKVLNGQVWQLQPIDSGQPWGVFLLEFKSPDAFVTGRGMTGPLRQILRGLVPSRRKSPHAPSWRREHLLFICTHNYQHFRIAYFKSPPDKTTAAPLAAFGWGPDVPARTACEFNLPPLAWPEDTNSGAWVQQWTTAFDVEKVTKRFYEHYSQIFAEVERMIGEKSGLKSPEDLRMFTQTLFNRLMFLRFIERKGWLEFHGRHDYLRAVFSTGGMGAKSLYLSRIRPLFFQGLATEDQAEQDAFGKVPFLNGGLFEENDLDRRAKDVPDVALKPMIGPEGLFYRYNFTIEESTPLDIEVAVDPEMLGKVFEELVTGRHETGSYYTPRPIVSFMCREAIKGFLSGKTTASTESIAKLLDEHTIEGLNESHAREVLSALDSLKAVDPACGSGAYLLGLLHELVAIYRLLYSERLVRNPRSLYDLKLRIISQNLYGVDIDPFATNIAMLRLWLSLAVEADEPVPLPNLDFKIETGDSLLGSCAVTSNRLDFEKSLRQRADKLVDLKDEFMKAHGNQKPKLRDAVLKEEAAIATELRTPRGVGIIDWRIQFADVMGRNGGFDIVLANPPYVNMVEMEKNAPEQRELLRQQFVTTSGGFDLFVPFIERGISLCRPKGMFAYIVPNKLLSAEYATSLRKHFIQEMTLGSITDLSSVPVFGAAVYPVIVIAQREKRPVDQVMVQICVTRGDSPDAIELRQSTLAPLHLATAAGGRWSPLLQSKSGTGLDGVLQRCKRLTEFTDEIAGAATVSEAYEWKNAVIDQGDAKLKSASSRYVPFVVSGNVRRYHTNWDTEKVQYIKQGYWHPVLDKRHSAITARRRQQIESLKVIVSGMSKRPTCFWDDRGIAAGKSTVIVIPKKTVLGEFVAAVINSQCMAQIYNSLFGSLSLSGGYLRFGPPQMRELPFPEASMIQQKEIADLARKCATAKGIGSEKWEKEIDLRVAALFGLELPTGAN